MNWNTKPGSSAIPPPSYPRRQSPFQEQPFRSPLGSAPQSSLTYPGQNPEAGVFLGSSDTGAQLPFGHPQAQPRNYGTTNMQSGTMLMSQTSEKVTYAGIRGSRHLDHNMQVPVGLSHSAWMNPTSRSSALPHQGTSGTLQSSFRMKAPSMVKALQNQFVTSDIYPMQLQMPVSSSHTPVSCQGSSRLNPPSMPEFPGHWTQQPPTPSGLACSEYRLPQQPYTYPSPSFVPEPTLQKPNPLPSLTSPVRNTHPSAAGLPLQTQQSVPRQPFQSTTAQPDARVTSYSCSYTGQPVPSTQQLPKHTVAELTRSQEPHTPGKFQPVWPKQCENLSTLGNFCSVKMKSSTGETFYEPTRASVSGMHTVPRSQEKRSAACVLPPNSPVDTNVTKEKLVRDIKTLVEIKNKFSELARKIKINKELLMAAGCIKTTNMSYNDSAPNSESAQKETEKVSSGSLLSLLTTEISENKELDQTQGTALSPGTLAPSCRKCGALGSGLHNPLCPEMLPVSAQGQGLVQVQTTSQTPTVERTQLSGSNTSFSLGSSLSIEQNASTNLETPLAFPPQSSGDCMAKYLHKHPIILSLLEVGDHAVPEKLLKDAQTLQDSKLPGSEARPRVPVTGQQLDLRTPEAPGPHNKSRMATDQALPLPVSASGGVTNSERPCSMDLLATCLSLWKNSPVEPARDVPREDPGTTLAASGSCSQSGLVAGGSGSTLASSSQDSVQSMAPQNYEPPAMTMSKGTELQVAVVTPLVLSSAKSLAVKGTSPETVYPMIKEDSVCSLQVCLAEEIGAPAALKVSLEEPTAGVASGTDSPKDWAPKNSEDKSHLCPRKQTQADSESPLPGDRDGERASEDRLQIDSICSLVKGDTSYNPQIAEMFNVPLCPVEEKQGQPDSLAEDRGTGLQEVSVSGKIPQSSDAPQSLEPSSQHLPETEPLPAPLHPENGNCTATDTNGLECHMEKTSLALDPGPVTAAEDGPSEGTAPGPTEEESPEEETPAFYLHDQLSELLKEFPYGVEPLNTCVAPESCHLPCHATVKPDEMSMAAGQIQITILNSEQMKVLFPEQDLQESVCETESQKRELESEDGGPPIAGSEDGATPAASSEDGGSPAAGSEDGGPPSAGSEDGTSLSAGSEDGGPQTTGCEDGDSSATGSEDRVSLGAGSEDGSPPTQVSEVEIQGGPPAQVQGEQNSKKDFQKEDMPCCALGWLSAIYEGVPQCQCSISEVKSTKPTKRKSGHSHSSQETLSHKQGGFSKNDSPLVPPERKRPLLGHPGKDRDRVKARPCTPGKNQQALPAQHLHSESRQPTPRHPNVGKLLTSEVYLSPGSAQARNSAENRPRKHPVPGLQPSKAETSLLCQNTQEPLPPGPRKLIPKAPLPGYKAWDKRKLEEGAALDSATKRRKIDKPEKGQGVGSSSSGKPWGSGSLPKEQRHKKERQEKEKALVSADGSPKTQRSMSPPKHKHREATAAKASKKDPRKVRPRDTQLLFLGKPVPVHTRPRGPRPAFEEASRACPSFGKSPQTQHPQESRIHGSRPGKPKDRLRTEKNQSHGHLGRSRLAGATGSMAPLAKDHRKLYLNRIGFQCTERESICLTRLDPSPRKPHREESSRKGAPSMKEGTEPPSMLEFKLCPEAMIPKAGHKDEHPLLKHGPRKDRLPTQVSGIKTKKEDWLKCVTEERKLPDATQEMGSRAVADPRPPKRTLSADGIDGIQRPAKDFRATFQTYKKMYMEKRSRSLGSSPLK